MVSEIIMKKPPALTGGFHYLPLLSYDILSFYYDAQLNPPCGTQAPDDEPLPKLANADIFRSTFLL